jgi:predicted 3-demethylubiquinone-9 3-methyltransferase (glyoxalase superfamily)
MTKTKIATCLWFDGVAEDAAQFYTRLVPGSEIGDILRADPQSPAIVVEFTLAGVPFQALNGGPQFVHSEAASIVVTTKDQEETDRIWHTLVELGGSEGVCGWCKDRFGVSWQVVPEAVQRLLGSSDRVAASRAMKAFLEMKKIDIAELEAAYAGETRAAGDTDKGGSSGK